MLTSSNLIVQQTVYFKTGGSEYGKTEALAYKNFGEAQSIPTDPGGFLIKIEYRQNNHKLTIIFK